MQRTISCHFCTVLCILRTESLNTEVYLKPTRTNQYLLFNSPHPVGQKVSNIRTLHHRAEKIPSRKRKRAQSHQGNTSVLAWDLSSQPRNLEKKKKHHHQTEKKRKNRHKNCVTPFPNTRYCSTSNLTPPSNIALRHSHVWIFTLTDACYLNSLPLPSCAVSTKV